MNSVANYYDEKTKTRHIVLDMRLESKHQWPAPGRLATLVKGDVYRHCCIGVEGLSRGIPVSAMRGCGMPSNLEGESYGEWKELWGTSLTADDYNRIFGTDESFSKSLEYHVLTHNRLYTSFGALAAAVNDQLASELWDGKVRGEEVSLEVMYGRVVQFGNTLRKLMRVLGERVGENWKVSVYVVHEAIKARRSEGSYDEEVTS